MVTLVSRFIIGGVLVGSVPLIAQLVSPRLAGMLMLVPMAALLSLGALWLDRGAGVTSQAAWGGLAGLIPLASFLLVVALTAGAGQIGPVLTLVLGLSSWLGTVALIQYSGAVFAWIPPLVAVVVARFGVAASEWRSEALGLWDVADPDEPRDDDDALPLYSWVETERVVVPSREWWAVYEGSPGVRLTDVDLARGRSWGSFKWCRSDGRRFLALDPGTVVWVRRNNRVESGVVESLEGVTDLVVDHGRFGERRLRYLVEAEWRASYRVRFPDEVGSERSGSGVVELPSDWLWSSQAAAERAPALAGSLALVL